MLRFNFFETRLRFPATLSGISLRATGPPERYEHLGEAAALKINRMIVTRDRLSGKRKDRDIDRAL